MSSIRVSGSKRIGYKYISDYNADFDEAVANIGATETTLVVNEACTMSANTTVPSTLSLKVLNGCPINRGGYKLTINGPFEAGLYQVFSGNGDVVFGEGSIAEAYPEWYGAVGDGSTDDAGAVQKILNAVGNVAEIVLTKCYGIGSSLELPEGGCVITSSISNSCFVDWDRYRYHIKCLFDDNTTSLFHYTSGKKKSTHTIRDLCINMNGKSTTCIMNEAKGSTTTCNWRLERLTIDNCGWHGIVINSGANTSRIYNCHIAAYGTFWDEDQNWIPDAFVKDSVGIWINACSDCMIAHNEIKKGFDYGMWIEGTATVVHSNISDQNNIGMYVHWGGHSMFYGNRTGKNRLAGIQVTSSDNIFVSNLVSDTNSTTRVPSVGDGPGFELLQSFSNVYADNILKTVDVGFLFNGGCKDNIIINNMSSEVSPVTTMYDYSAIPSNGYWNYISDFENGEMVLYNNSLRAKRTRDFYQWVFHGHIKMGEELVTSEGSHIIPYCTSQSPSSNIDITPSDGQYIEIDPSANISVGWSDFSSHHYGSIVTIRNKSNSYTISMAGVTIGTGEVKQFIYTADGFKPITG